MNALGMIEVYGYLPAVEALDSALKAANVSLVDVTKVTGGLVSVMISGDVGAVKAAIDAASASASRLGDIISVHVIARPSDDVERMLRGSRKEDPRPPVPAQNVPETGAEDASEREPETQTSSAEDSGEETSSGNTVTAAGSQALPEKREAESRPLQEMSVSELRTLARELEIPGMSKHDIRYAKKGQLIQAISRHTEQES